MWRAKCFDTCCQGVPRKGARPGSGDRIPLHTGKFPPCHGSLQNTSRKPVPERNTERPAGQIKMHMPYGLLGQLETCSKKGKYVE